MLVAQHIRNLFSEADFAIGDDAPLPDYLRMNTPLSLEPIDLGFEEQWQLLPLFGWQAEALEDVCKTWQDWILEQSQHS